MSHRVSRTAALSVALVACLVSSGRFLSVAAAARSPHVPVHAIEQTANPAGATKTRLADGRWLIVGAEGTGTAAIVDPRDGRATPITAGLEARTGHSATLLSDGTVLIAGGVGPAGDPMTTASVFDPASNTFLPLIISGAQPRAAQTATLLTDGRVVIVGGTGVDGHPLNEAEIWDVGRAVATAVPGVLAHSRAGHRAELLADGRVLVTGGMGIDGMSVTGAEVFDPTTQQFRIEPAPDVDLTAPRLTASLPEDGATDVPLDVRAALRFSQPLRAESLTAQTVGLAGPDGPVDVTIIPAEGGRLAFVLPRVPLAPAATYVLTIDGAVDERGVPVLPASVALTTIASSRSAQVPTDLEGWTPSAEGAPHGWRSNRPDSPWRSLAPLQAPPGVTALSGQVLRLDGRPLADVTLGMDATNTTRSDRTGRFLLKLTTGAPGRRVLRIDGHTASHGSRTYGFFEYGTAVAPGRTTVLPFTIWLPKLDTAHAVTIPSPTISEVVITTPSIPGLELHIPPQTVIRDEEGHPVTQVSITAIPIDRPPFPLATNVVVPVYFTVQPGSAYVQTLGAGTPGAWLVYPNYRHDDPGQRLQFFHYDPGVKDWYVYGTGNVTANGRQVMPDVTTRLYEFTGAMINDGDSPPASGGTWGGPSTAEPIDPSTGVFLMHKTDLFLPDVIPVALSRTYNSGDSIGRSFGRGMTHPYAMFLWSAKQYEQADLVLPEGGLIHYVRISSGTSWADAVFEHTTTPTEFYKSTIAWNGNGWNLALKDGTVYVFGELAPLQAIRDRYGNTVTISHASGQSGNISRVTSPNGRFITFTYDASNRITQAKDNIGRTVVYTYDANGNLSTVTDPENGVTTYTYDASNQLATIKDARNIVYLTNEYTNGRVTRQTLADLSATYQLAYTVDGSGNITQTDITDPRGHIERLAFNANHYTVSETAALSTAQARTTTIERQAGSNLVLATVDGLSRRTEFAYDPTGHVLTTTRLAGTPDAVTTSYTYEPMFSQVATMTDPVGHTWTRSYSPTGKPTSATDPLTHQSTMTVNTMGQVTAMTDPLQHAWQIGHSNGDVTSVTDPLNAVRSKFVDAAGRLVAVTDPLGHVTQMLSDKLNRLRVIIDPAGGQKSFAYDPNSNLSALTDALMHATTYTYDTSDRVATRTDPMGQADTFQYDGNDHLTQAIDRKGQVTTYAYDALDRLTHVAYATASTVDYTYDTGDRVTLIVDSLAGTITRQYDLLDRVTSETTPEGTVSYTYDGDGRRTTMTVFGQPIVAYAYDAAHRLTSITQGTAVMALTYDAADRRSTLTFPNGILATYVYDNVNRLTGLAYTRNGIPVGDLSYTYDAAGNRTSVGGTWARTGLSQTVASPTYDAANRIASWAGTAFSYDLNGNLTSDGTNTYTWNVRDELTALSGSSIATFQYDAVGRRRVRTIGATSTNFLYDGLNLVQELSGTTPSANLLTGLSIDETFTRTDASGTSILLTDALGSTLALAAVSGIVQTQYTYDPFGSTTASGVTSTNSSEYTGRENDGTGLYYYRARYYMPTTQRFVGEDPLGSGGGDSNLYSYALNNPTNWIDSLGLTACPTDDPTVTGPYGERRPRHPHDGTDFRNRDIGGNVYATEDGWVNDVYSAPGGGNQIVIDNSDGSRTGDAHTTAYVQPGDQVFEGEVIGFSDGSGGVTPHTHHTYRACPGCDKEDPVPHLPPDCAHRPPPVPRPPGRPPRVPRRPMPRPPGAGRGGYS